MRNTSRAQVIPALSHSRPRIPRSYTRRRRQTARAVCSRSNTADLFAAT